MKEETKEKVSDWCHGHLPYWMWQVHHKVRDIKMYIRHCFQKVFRRNHVSDYDTWSVYTPMAKSMRRYLQAFIDSPRHGYPMAFSEYADHPKWAHGEMTEEEYYTKYPGGGPDRWEHYLKEMLYALDYAIVDLDLYEEENTWFYKKYNITMDDFERSVGHWDQLDWDYDYLSMKKDVVEKLYKRHETGMKYFAEYFLSLWD